VGDKFAADGKKGSGADRLVSQSAPGLRVQCRFRTKRSEFEGDRSRETRAGVVQAPDGRIALSSAGSRSRRRERGR